MSSSTTFVRFVIPLPRSRPSPRRTVRREHRRAPLAKPGPGTIQNDADPARISESDRIASITRLFTSVLVLQLHQKGRLDVHATIGAVLPDYPGEGADRVLR